MTTDRTYRRELIGVYTLLAAMNVGAWLWALVVFRGQPVPLGVAVVVYGLGLRHAVDADHIAAIDNVTRKLFQEGKRSASIGFWFALGHSSVILLATAAVVLAAGRLGRFQAVREIGGTLSMAVSGVFLLLVAAMNLCILLAIIRTVRRVRAGELVEPAEVNVLFAGNGLLARLFRPLFRWISRPWHMAPLGFLFGLSFDTASEVALFGIAATQAAHGTALASALIYPVLFAAAMSLLDTTDGVMMVSAYHRAVEDPLRRLYYNLAITMLSVAAAVSIGAIQLGRVLLQLAGSTSPLRGRLAAFSDHSSLVGGAIVAMFAAVWLASLASGRAALPVLSGRGADA